MGRILPELSRREILVDADSCPVKEEIYKAAFRHEIPVILVAATYLRHPDHPLLSMQMAGSAFDAADDVIAERATPHSLVITADILLAERCLAAGAPVLNPKGERFTSSSIGAQVATRALMADLRSGLEGQVLGGAKPFSKADRARFSNAIELALRQLK